MRDPVTWQLEIHDEFLQDLLDGTKTFEVREKRDRDFTELDVLVFQRDDTLHSFLVTYVLEDWAGLAPDHAVMAVVYLGSVTT